MIRIERLKCGTTLVMEKIDHIKSAALGIWTAVGSVDENDEISGISHFIEHMMFKGTEKRTARELAEDVDKIGGMMNAFTGRESTCYYIKTLSSNIIKGAEIILDMLVDSIFDSEELEKERNVICEEIKMISDTPDEDVHEIINSLVAGGDSMGRSIIGTSESLARIDREKMVEYFQNKYSRDNTVIAICGNFSEEEMISFFEGKLLSLSQSKTVEHNEIMPYKQDFKVKVKDIEQTHVCIAVPGISLADSRYYAFVVMNSILGGSMSSRLFQKIREEKGLAYSVYSANVMGSKKGFFNIYAGVSHDKIGEALSSIKYELESISTRGVTVEELAMAKEQVKSLYIFSLENVNSRMFSIGKNKLLLNRTYTPDEVLEGFDSVSATDVLEASRFIGDYSSYCGAVISGRDVDIKKMIIG